MKSEIIERLGQADLLLPALIAEGLAANDRVKLRLSVLQAATHRACEPTGARFDLTGECRAAGVDHVALEALVNRATLSVSQRISAPGLGSLGAAIWDDVATMIRAVKAGDQQEGNKADERLSAIRALTPFGASDDVELRQVTRLTGLSDGGGDSLHRLVMDLHKALNRLAAGSRGRNVRGRARLRIAARGSAGGRSIHARGRGDREAQVRSSRIGDDRDASGRTAYDPERYRRDRRACRGDRRRAGRRHRHVHRRASGARKIPYRTIPQFPRSVERT